MFVQILLGNVLIFSALFIFFCHLALSPKQTKENLTRFLLEMWNNPEYYMVSRFWSTQFWERKREKQQHLIWELPFLYLLSFYTLIRTRFLILHQIIIFKGVFFFFFFGDYFILLCYTGTALILTALVAIPQVRNHLFFVYSPSVFKNVGWNGLFKTMITHSSTATKALLGAAGTAALNEVVSPVVGYVRGQVFIDAHEKANAAILAHNKICTTHNMPLQELQPFNADAYIRARKVNVLHDILLPLITPGKN